MKNRLYLIPGDAVLSEYIHIHKYPILVDYGVLCDIHNVHYCVVEPSYGSRNQETVHYT